VLDVAGIGDGVTSYSVVDLAIRRNAWFDLSHSNSDAMQQRLGDADA
jgi:hypothetical protein